LDDFESLKREVEEDEKAYQRAKGRAAELLRQMKERFGVKTEEQAERLLAKWGEEERKAAVEFSARVKAYLAERGKRDARRVEGRE
jgi:hypothetical protein